MILAGIDEAGYGPLLGPLVVGCAALSLPDSPGDVPDVWHLLRKSLGKKRSKSGTRLHVNDSKLVYSTDNGLKELEKSVLCFLANHSVMPASLEELLTCLAGHMMSDLPQHRWYSPCEGENFPIACDAMSIRLMSNGLRADMRSAGVGVVHLGARVMLERPLNRMFDATKNKSNTLFSLAAIHIDALIRQFTGQNLTIFCDRQGGREHYGHVLRQMFEDFSLAIVSETPQRGEYLLSNTAGVVRVIFTEKAESQCLPTALASMICKYLRESLMHRFNRFWRSHLPDIKPTAGYYTDGMRFLAEIAGKRAELGIKDEDFVRSR